jgi:hypothetical protein
MKPYDRSTALTVANGTQVTPATRREARIQTAKAEEFNKRHAIAAEIEGRERRSNEAQEQFELRSEKARADHRVHMVNETKRLETALDDLDEVRLRNEKNQARRDAERARLKGGMNR